MMERLTVRTAKGAALKMADACMDEDSARAYLMRKYCIAVDRLAAYEDAGLEPEDITTRPDICVFYCNRKCNLDGDWCSEGPGCPHEMDAETIKTRLFADKVNDPLTLEELREMDGKPVWLVGVSSINDFKGHWDICDGEYFGGKGRIFFSHCAEAPDADLCGKTWFAYRRKPEGMQ